MAMSDKERSRFHSAVDRLGRAAEFCDDEAENVAYKALLDLFDCVAEAHYQQGYQAGQLSNPVPPVGSPVQYKTWASHNTKIEGDD